MEWAHLWTSRPGVHPAGPCPLLVWLHSQAASDWLPSLSVAHDVAMSGLSSSLAAERCPTPCQHQNNTQTRQDTKESTAPPCYIHAHPSPSSWPRRWKRDNHHPLIDMHFPQEHLRLLQPGTLTHTRAHIRRPLLIVMDTHHLGQPASNPCHTHKTQFPPRPPTAHKKHNKNTTTRDNNWIQHKTRQWHAWQDGMGVLHEDETRHWGCSNECEWQQKNMRQLNINNKKHEITSQKQGGNINSKKYAATRKNNNITHTRDVHKEHH